eukprot:scaffold518_cov388-Prasinococcus_capsulatus_cf.AAC.27
MLESTYRSDPFRRAFFGHSLSALFGVWELQHMVRASSNQPLLHMSRVVPNDFCPSLTATSSIFLTLLGVPWGAQSYFSAYVLGSPSLWWDDGVVLREVKGRSEIENGSANGHVAKAKGGAAKLVLVIVGGEEKEQTVRHAHAWARPAPASGR